MNREKRFCFPFFALSPLLTPPMSTSIILCHSILHGRLYCHFHSRHSRLGSCLYGCLDLRSNIQTIPFIVASLVTFIATFINEFIIFMSTLKVGINFTFSDAILVAFFVIVTVTFGVTIILAFAAMWGLRAHCCWPNALMTSNTALPTCTRLG